MVLNVRYIHNLDITTKRERQHRITYTIFSE